MTRFSAVTCHQDSDIQHGGTEMAVVVHVPATTFTNINIQQIQPAQSRIRLAAQMAVHCLIHKAKWVIRRATRRANVKNYSLTGPQVLLFHFAALDFSVKYTLNNFRDLLYLYLCVLHQLSYDSIITYITIFYTHHTPWDLRPSLQVQILFLSCNSLLA